MEKRRKGLSSQTNHQQGPSTIEKKQETKQQHNAETKKQNQHANLYREDTHYQKYSFKPQLVNKVDVNKIKTKNTHQSERVEKQKIES